MASPELLQRINHFLSIEKELVGVVESVASCSAHQPAEQLSMLGGYSTCCPSPSSTPTQMIKESAPEEISEGHSSNCYTGTHQSRRSLPANLQSPSKRKRFQFMMDHVHSSPSLWLTSPPWASSLLMATAKAIARKQTDHAHHILSFLDSLVSPSADLQQRLDYYNAESLRCKMEGLSDDVLHDVWTTAQMMSSFNVVMDAMLIWREVNPSIAFGHVAANLALLNALDANKALHIVDISHWANLFTQWPSFIQALARRSTTPTPKLKITLVMIRKDAMFMHAFDEAGARLLRFAQLTGVCLEIHAIEEPDVLNLTPETLNIQPDESLAFNVNQSLHWVPIRERVSVLKVFRQSNPKIVVAVEDEVDQLSTHFDQRFHALYKFLSIFMGSLGHNATKMHIETQARVARFVLITNVVFDEDDDGDHLEANAGKEVKCCERREKSCQWKRRFVEAGYHASPLGECGIHNVENLLTVYSHHWKVQRFSKEESTEDFGLTLTWKNRPFVSCMAWR